MEELAKQYKADRVWLNPGRFWMMDHVWVNKTGEPADFCGMIVFEELT